MIQQPIWKLVASVGDINPIDYGGAFVFKDETGVYDPEMEILTRHSDDDGSKFTVVRFGLPKCTYQNGILSDNKFHPEIPAWFSEPESQRTERPQDTTYLSNVADFIGVELAELIEMFLSDDLAQRGMAWQAVGDYHGFDNLDSYPLVLTESEVRERYADILTNSGRVITQ